MLTRRSALAMIGSLPAGTLLWSAPKTTVANVAELTSENCFDPDRELTLKLSERFRVNHWIYAGQQYLEHDKEIEFDEGEYIRFTLVNDTTQPQSFEFDGTRVELPALGSKRFDLFIDSLDARSLQHSARKSVQTIRVRPSYQSHGTFLA